MRFHHDYIISKIINKKLSQQRVEFFTILDKINNFVYQLKFSSIIFIYFVIFIVQLEFLFIDVDFYRRSKFDEKIFSSIIMKNNDLISYYEIERLLDRRTSRNKIQYFVK